MSVKNARVKLLLVLAPVFACGPSTAGEWMLGDFTGRGQLGWGPDDTAQNFEIRDDRSVVVTSVLNCGSRDVERYAVWEPRDEDTIVIRGVEGDDSYLGEQQEEIVSLAQKCSPLGSEFLELEHVEGDFRFMGGIARGTVCLRGEDEVETYGTSCEASWCEEPPPCPYDEIAEG